MCGVYQVHLLKLFDNVKTLFFARGNKVVTGMESSEGEGFNFKTLTNVEGPVRRRSQGSAHIHV